jgi:methylated-DNA-[protein]-cysteine S-methyltransferase
MAMTEGVCSLGAGAVRVIWEGDVVFEVEFCDREPFGTVPEALAAYCRGEPADLSALRSVAYDRPGISAEIYRKVAKVPYGTTTTYGTIARLIGTSARAVGQAMRRNPTPLVVPCHRVIAADGTLRGFTPSLAIKAALLAIEERNAPQALNAPEKNLRES